MESSSQKIHEDLNSVIDYQTHHRLREAQSRKRAEDLNERVLFWAVGETLGILVIAVGQVMVLKNFFAEKKANQASYWTTNFLRAARSTLLLKMNKDVSYRLNILWCHSIFMLPSLEWIM